jgi:LemA protein
MKKLGCFVAVLVGLVLVVAVFGVKTYNGLVKGNEGVKAAWAQVENQLQRRMDLIPNLVETVKGYASHERETLEAVVQARSRVAGAGSVNEKMAANDQLSGALSRLLVVVEQYPNLKADQTFIRLQDELAGTENRIAVERRRYNEIARDFNVQLRSFPTVLFGGLLGFKGKDLFEAQEGAAQAPKVSFGSSPAPAEGR